MHSPFGNKRGAMCATTNYIMMYLTILCIILVMTSAQMSSKMAQPSQKELKTIIHNKNVNIIVNLDPKEVAKELWKVIETRLSNGTIHITSSMSAIRDLERAVTPLIEPTRRGGIPSSVFQVASQLDQITRRALTRDTPAINTLDKEIMTRDIVADMMASLKVLLSVTIQSKIDEANTHSRRTMHNSGAMHDDERDDDYVNVGLKINRRDIINALY